TDSRSSSPRPWTDICSRASASAQAASRRSARNSKPSASRASSPRPLAEGTSQVSPYAGRPASASSGNGSSAKAGATSTTQLGLKPRRLDELDESSVGDPVVVDLDLGATVAVAGDGAEDAGLRPQDLLHARLVLGAVHPAHEKEHGGHDPARLSDVDHDPVDLRSPAR